uniref:EF-hand domain-containing protein n=1 Tax=Globodera rostochiensis TaxID=31243 RepID=A0A914I636_GLORO
MDLSAQVEELFFKLVDDNNDGIMSVQEYERGLQSLMKGGSAVLDAFSGMEKGRAFEEELRKSIGPKKVAEYDKNGDGWVTLDEMLQQIRVEAQKADTDGDGTISKEELRQHKS